MRKKILLVDDASTIRSLERILLQSDYDIVEAKDGKQGVDAAQQHQPDLVLMDINMPVQDGITSLKQLRENPTTKHIPVIMVSTRSEMQHVAACQALGCADFVYKPIDRTALIEAILRAFGAAT